MNAGQAAKRIGHLLEQDRLDYAIGGALALGVWGAPHGTKDLDLSVFLTFDEYERVADAFERIDVMFDRHDAAKALARVGFFCGKLGRVVVDVFILRSSALSRDAAAAAFRDPVDGTHLYFITAEDLCVMPGHRRSRAPVRDPTDARRRVRAYVARADAGRVGARRDPR